jgi:hypothetical protein
VKQRYSLTFSEQRARYALRFTCEHCSHFQVDRASCTHGYPTSVHRSARYERPSEDTELVFCKDFDLW